MLASEAFQGGDLGVLRCVRQVCGLLRPEKKQCEEEEEQQREDEEEKKERMRMRR